jgi:hypothetical protein
MWILILQHACSTVQYSTALASARTRNALEDQLQRLCASASRRIRVMPAPLLDETVQSLQGVLQGEQHAQQLHAGRVALLHAVRLWVIS